MLSLFSEDIKYMFNCLTKISNENFMPNVLVFHVLKFSTLGTKKESYADKMD